MDGTITGGTTTQEALLRLWDEKRDMLGISDPERVAQLRQNAMQGFRNLGFPHTKLEKWRNTDLSRMLGNAFTFPFEAQIENVDLDEVFKCDVPGFNTFMVAQYNGRYIERGNRLADASRGVIVCSLSEAFSKHADLIEKHFGRYADVENNSLTALNTAFAKEGVFIYVPDNVEVTEIIQVVNIINSDETVFLQPRNLVIAGRNSSLKLVQCDDSIDDHPGFINAVTEVYAGENSVIDHYKLQNKNDRSALVNSMYFQLEAGSSLSTNAISLNGGLIRNETNVKLNGRGSHADVLGVYLMDRNQHVDNQVFIDHAMPDCTSNELFKGILDDHASGVFNGHILVRKDAQRTNAYQNNKNILISDKAVIDTKPFLEIYADDVKCSHGATVGQLDPEAMFYLRSRGISQDNARMLLMYAFAAEIVNRISIPQLRLRIDDLVKKRLRGELSVCDQCVLHCNAREQKVAFEIDMSKI
ncbi:MAG: Fe-S cluster assembly protein SufD [Bacteroidales bacterium]|jgi:Fe-S cluster assembly protein SufD|nr:Fe-S cluster assembly protein SufD [Bacteroidales bacterium]